ncbi:esterase/lipase family protein [Rhodococcoides kyotonense]|uniref:Triacylglycerol esterase/lipase EstA, alpha/beta hydrolase fold n=1 Tax=Rhodococcoides kyotonense TaxID=398843 RepID=A0A239J832_9NOCA|nr:alpha/beta fold hydrolase [Rhodococcus kyotonensis]SNT02027.1 Triacylglycerol esterase/lipase EstA, alpha/beta hydrolase fold [Rhodococcus kyotonensis]
MNHRLTLAICAASIALGAGVASAAPVVPTIPGPPQSNHADAIRYSEQHPGATPPGVNDFDCVPSPEHPNPVVLVHGTDATAYADWAGFGPVLQAQGYCAYALNYGLSPDGTTYGYSDIRGSAEELSEFTEQVRASTGAEKVDIVGYSQGAAVSRYYTNELGGAAVVDKWIGIASPTYGGTAYGFSPAVQSVPGGTTLVSSEFGPALVQLLQGSEFLTQLNAHGDTVPGVQYTSIATRVDETIQPYTNALFHDPNVNNVVVQDVCPENNVAHFTITYDPTALGLALAALDPDAGIVPYCGPVPLGAGILDVIIASN